MANMSEFISRLERLGSQEVKERIAAKVRAAVHDECLRGFTEERDPYGVPWARRKDPRGQWPILQKTGTGVESLTSSGSNGVVRLRIVGYFRFHQGGTRKMVARKIFPDAYRGLGSWSEPVRAASVDAVRELVNGR